MSMPSIKNKATVATTQLNLKEKYDRQSLTNLRNKSAKKGFKNEIKNQKNQKNQQHKDALGGGGRGVGGRQHLRAAIVQEAGNGRELASALDHLGGGRDT